MNDLILAIESTSELEGIQQLQALALAGVGSAHSRRAYEGAIEEFIAWSLHGGKIRINAAQLRAYQAYLTTRHPHTYGNGTNIEKELAPSTVNVKMAAVRSLVHSAAAAGWIAEQDEELILKRVKSRPVAGPPRGAAHAAGRCTTLPPPPRPGDSGGQARLCVAGNSVCLRAAPGRALCS